MPFPYKLTNTMPANKIYPQLTGYKFLVLGHGGHGKDTIGELLENIYGMPSCSSSWFACENVVMPAFGLSNEDGNPCNACSGTGGYGTTCHVCEGNGNNEKLEGTAYNSLKECYDDRSNHRQFWYDAISEFNDPEPDKLACELLEQYDVYTGMRSPLEYGACIAAQLFDAVFWVNASPRVGFEDAGSMGIVYDPRTMLFINNANSPARAESYLSSHMDRILESLETGNQGAKR